MGQLALPDLLALEKEVSAAHKTLAEGTGEGNDFLGWLNLPTYEETAEMQRISQAAARIRENSEALSLWESAAPIWDPGPQLSSCTEPTTICSAA